MFFLAWFGLWTLGFAQEFAPDIECCEKFIEEPNCSKKCIQILSQYNSSFSQDDFQCAVNQRDLMQCIMRTTSGLPINTPLCCDMAIDNRCADSCAMGSNLDNFDAKCDRVSEVALYSCVNDYLYMKDCCHSDNVELGCAVACNSATELGPRLSDWVNIRKECDPTFPAVKQCMTRTTGTSSSSRHKCCNKSSSEQCRYICDRAMSGDYTQAEQLSALFEACGDPIEDATWLCIMQEDSAGKAPLGELTAVQCCRKGAFQTCRSLCLQLYSDWLDRDVWQQFTDKCRYVPREEEMTNCILDVSEPCTLGCDQLSFCSNLNNRPLDLFRTCSNQYDLGAEIDYNMWVQAGVIETPLVNIPVVNITTCQPDVWKAIACMLQTKPCHPKSHSNSICNSGCVSLLTVCLDHTRTDQSVGEICGLLAPNTDPDHCLDINHYMSPSSPESRGQLTHPCNPSPCGVGQQCVLNRNCASEDMYCIPYMCLDSCSVGTLRDYQIEVGSWIRLPLENSDCFKVCTCDSQKKLSDCQHLQCPGTKNCQIGDTSYMHLSQFQYLCNTCVCYSGLLTCTKRTCYTHEEGISSTFGKAAAVVHLPGNCQPYYSPVCGVNGATYPNPCTARQFDMRDSQLHYTSCDTVNVCAAALCDKGQVCRPRRQTCLDFRLACPQYTCETPAINCKGEDLEPVCDTDNVQHPHMCSIVQQEKTLLHKGYCLGSCNITSGSVCGANGRTYSSRCAAQNDYIVVDYEGSCIPPTDADFEQGRYCAFSVKCPSLPTQCIAQSVAGMCCPVCGGVLYLLPSQGLVAVNQLYMNDRALSVRLLCLKLTSLLSLSECGMSCYLGVDGDVVAIVSSSVVQPSWIQIEACNNEAKKLEAMVKLQHVRMQSDLVLSTIIGARVSPARISKPGTVSASSRPTYAALVVMLVLMIIRG